MEQPVNKELDAKLEESRKPNEKLGASRRVVVAEHHSMIAQPSREPAGFLYPGFARLHGCMSGESVRSGDLFSPKGFCWAFIWF